MKYVIVVLLMTSFCVNAKFELTFVGKVPNVDLDVEDGLAKRYLELDAENMKDNSLNQKGILSADNEVKAHKIVSTEVASKDSSHYVGKPILPPINNKKRTLVSYVAPAPINVDRVKSLNYVHKGTNGKYPDGERYVAQLGAFGNPIYAYSFYKNIVAKEPTALIFKPSNKNQLALTYVVIPTPSKNVDDYIKALNKRLKLNVSVKQAVMNKPVLKAYIASKQDTHKPTSKLDDGVTENTNIAQAVREYDVNKNDTLYSTLSKWEPTKKIIYNSESLWVQKIVFDKTYECGNDVNAAISKLESLINNNPNMIDKHIKVIFKVSKDKIEVSHES